MARVAAPQARLAWHAAPPAARTTAPITQQAFALWPSFTPKPHHHKSGPPPDYTLDVQGAFELNKDGGVRVAGLAVKIERGTHVARAFGGGAKGTNGSLWWAGAHEEVQGFWTLWLLGADEADLVAVHRILLFLPPLPQQFNLKVQIDTTLARPRPLPTTRTLGPTNPIASLQSSFASIQGPKPEYRNSLLLVDDDTNEVIAILPLDSLQSPPPIEATFAIAELGKALPPLPPTPTRRALLHQHSPSLEKELAIDLTRGRALADQVDEIVSHLSPGRKHKHAPQGDEEAHMIARERDGEDDGKRDGGRRSEGRVKDEVCEGEGGIFLNLATSGGGASAQTSPTRSTRGGSVAEEAEEEMGKRTLEKLKHGFELLDAQMGTLGPYASPPFVPNAQPTPQDKDSYESPPFSPVPSPSPRIRDPYESPPFMPEAANSPSTARTASDPCASPPLIPASSSSRPLTFVDPIFSIPPTPTSIPLATILTAEAPTFEHPQLSQLRPAKEGSISSVSTLATLGTERRFATATEGHEREESRRTSSATFSTAMEGREDLDSEALDKKDTEDLSLDFADLSSQSQPQPQPQPQPRHAPSLSILSSAPSHALTPSNDNSNSVLLQFLGSRSTITARLVSEEDIAREGLVPATVDAEEMKGEGKEGEGWGWWSLFSGWKVEESSWGSWLKGWWSTAPTSDVTSTSSTPTHVSSPHPSATVNAPTSYASNFFIPSFSASSLASTPRPIPRSRPRRANGEVTSRLSVVFYDEEGYGRAAYVDGAGGGFGARGPVGGVGGGY